MNDAPFARFSVRRLAFFALVLFVGAVAMENVLLVEGVGRISRLVGFVSAGSWLAVILVGRDLRKPVAFHYLVVLFVVWHALTFFWTVDPDRTSARVTTYLQLAVMMAVLWELVRTPGQLDLLYQAYVVGAYVSALSTIANFESGEAYYAGRYAAAGFHPNGLGIILVMGIPMAWHLSTAAETRKAKWLRLLNLGYIPVSLAAIALTGTRTAVIAAVPAGLYALASLRHVRPSIRALLAAPILAAIVGLYTLVPPASFQRIATMGTELAEGDLNGRVNLWRDAWGYFKAHPLVGVGSDGFVALEGHVAHNAFISVAVESGAIGLLLFGLIVLVVVEETLKLPRDKRQFLLSLVATWALGAMALTWEQKKTTWLIMSFVILTAHAVGREEAFEEQETLRPARHRKAQISGAMRDALAGPAGHGSVPPDSSARFPR